MRHFYSLVLMLLLAASVHAQTTTIWLGGSTDWDDPANWSDGVPTTGFTATIPANPPNGTNFPVFTGGPLIDFTIQSFGGSVTFDAVVYNTGSIVNSGGGSMISNQVFINAGMVEFNNNDGTFVNNGTVDNYGTFNNAGTSTLDNPAGSIFNNFGNIDNFGTIINGGDITNNGNITSTNTIQNNGTITNNNFLDIAFGGNYTNGSGSVLNNAAGAFVEVNSNFVNDGTVNTDGSFFIQTASVFDNNGTMTSNGRFDLSGQIENGGTFTSNDVMFINDSGVLTNDNVFTNNGTITLSICGQIIQNANNTIAGTILNDGIIYTLNGNVIVTDNLDFGSEFTDLNQRKAPDTKCRSGMFVFLDENGQGSITVDAVDKNSFGFCGATLATRVLSQSTFTVADLGVNELTLTITDDFGESSSCTSFITVIDYFPPVVPVDDPDITFSCPADITVTPLAGGASVAASWTEPTATTSCTGGSTGGGAISCTNISNTISGYTFIGEYNDSKYFISTSNSTWHAARSNAEANGGHLVTINDAAENAFIVANTSGKAWIGFNDQNSEGNFEWVSGEPVTYTNWNSGEPNNFGTGEDVTEILNSGRWNDNSTNSTRRHILEIACPATPSCPDVNENISGFNFIGEFNDSKYFLSTSSSNNYDDALALAANTGGHLVTIGDAAENQFVRDNLPAGSSAWLGYSDEVSEGNYVWINGEPTTYTNWSNGEPNDTLGTDNFARIRQNNGTWTDRNGATNHYYVVLEVDCYQGGVSCTNVNTNIPSTTYLGQFGDSQYFVSNHAKTWTEAKAFAESNGGHLAVIDDQVENDFIQNNINPASGSVWIGLTNNNNGNNFEWVNNDPVVYTNWNSGEPNETSNHVAARLLNNSGKWTDRTLNNLYEVVFEIPCNNGNGNGGGNGDNGLTVTQITGGQNGGQFPVGVNEVSYSVTDNCGNEEICTFTVTVEENPAEITVSNCPADIIVSTAPGAPTANVSWTAPTATTSCFQPNATVEQTIGLESGSDFLIGTQNIAYSITDSCGNFQACSFNVTVQAVQATLTLDACPGDQAIQVPAGQTSATATWAEPTGTSDCFTGSVVANRLVGAASGSSFPLGTTQVVYVLTDECGNSALCAFNISVSESCPAAGTPCDDGDPSTENDVEDGNCGCAGTPCPAAGLSCDDGNPATENDVTDGNCGCTGTPCPVAGSSCDDGDPSTFNDVEDGNCGCAGTPCPVAGTSCDDGNPSTFNDMEDGNCNCVGTTDCGSQASPITFEDGGTETSICVDGEGDPLNVELTGTSTGTNSGWIITDDSNNILGLPAGPPFDLDGAGVGNCIIWYVRYEADFTGNVVGNNLSDLSGCFDLSNGITVIREAADGATVNIVGGGTSYTGTIGNIVFDVENTTTAPNLSYWYIITDENDNILGFLNSADGNTIDLSGAPEGECHIWGWSYRGEPDPTIGAPISSLNDGTCEDVSDNFITVIREAGCPAAGTPCDDGDPTTENDVEDGNCNCVGTPCPDAGLTCDDGNPNTENDVTDGTCGCAGTPIGGGTCTTTENLALASIASATQSSTQLGAEASRAIDGNTSGNFFGQNSVSLTNWEANAWLEIDLGVVANIETINIYNREDCCQQFLSNYYIFVSDFPFTSTDLNTTLNQTGVSNYLQTTDAGFPSDVTINTTGRYVRVQLVGTSFLGLAEVEVIGCISGTGCLPAGTPCDDGDATTENDVEDGDCGCAGTPCPVVGLSCDDGNPNTENDVTDGTCGCAGTPINNGGTCTTTSNLALDGTATESSEQFGATGDRAIDGNVDGDFWNGNSVALTAWETQPWVEIDLGQISNIESFNIYNRTDCCSGFLKNYHILISDVPFTSTDLAATQAQAGVIDIFETAAVGSPSTITAPANTTGRYVRLQLNGTSFLGVAEFEIIGCVGVGGCPAAGTACDDGDASTFNDVEDGDCGCSGTPCPTAGTTCDDGDPNTTNDVEDGNCNCAGTPINCADAGTACDDGDPSTFNDVEDGDCGCAGTPCPTAGTTCDDGNPNTENDVEDGNCNCAGTPINTGGCTTTSNLALNGSASQINTLNIAGFNGVAENAIDGNTDGVIFDGTPGDASVTGTQFVTEPYWEVELDGTYLIEEINVYNRTDGSDRSNNVYVLISDTPFTRADLAGARDEADWEEFIPGLVGSPSIVLPNIEGKYVRIQMDGDGYLVLAEVEVIGCTASTSNFAIPNMLFFNAEKVGIQTEVSWMMMKDVAVDFYEVEVSTDGTNFRLLNDLNADRIDAPREYNTKDLNPAFGENFYRLKVNNLDGTYFYSAVKRLTYDIDFDEVIVYPNPTSNFIRVALRDFAGKSGTIEIFNSLGQRMVIRDYQVIPEVPAKFNVENFVGGIYTISIKIDNHKRFTKKFIVSKL